MQPQEASAESDEVEQLRAEVAHPDREALEAEPPPRMDPNAARRSFARQQPSGFDGLRTGFDALRDDWLNR